MKTVSIVACLMVVLIVAPMSSRADDATVEELVNKAVELWKEKGKDYAVKVMNASAGPLKKGSLYVFAGDFKGVVLAHPTQQAIRGKDQWELQDAKGTFLTQEFIKAAKSPEGFAWVNYEWMRVNESIPTKKRAFIKRIPGEDVYVGCGYYLQ